MHDIINLFGVIEIPTFGFMIAIGVLFFVLLLIYLLRKQFVNEYSIDNIIIVGGISGIIFALGAHVFDTLWHSISYMKEFGTPFKMMWSEGGITFSGGLFCGIICYFIIYPFFMKKERHNIFFYFDYIAIGICIAHAFGRLGCYFGGCCYGKVVPQGTFLSMLYPTENGWENVYPTQLFESVFLFGLFATLLFFVKKNRSAWYLIGYNVFRFVLEYFRGDDRGLSPFGVLTPSQLMGIILLVGGIVILFFRNQIENKLKPAIDNTDDEVTTTNEQTNIPVVKQDLYECKFLNHLRKHSFTYFYSLALTLVLSMVLFGCLGNGVSSRASATQVANKIQKGENISFDWTYDKLNYSANIKIEDKNTLRIETAFNNNIYYFYPQTGDLIINLDKDQAVIRDTAHYVYKFHLYHKKSASVEYFGTYKEYQRNTILSYYIDKIPNFDQLPESEQKDYINAITEKVNDDTNMIRSFVSQSALKIKNNTTGYLNIVFIIIIILEALLLLAYTLFYFFGHRIFKIKQLEGSNE